MKPPVTLENYQQVYEYYLTHQQSRFMARMAYRMLAYKLRPKVSYTSGAKEQLSALVENRTPILLALNHIDDQRDAKVTSAAAWKSPIRPLLGRLRVLAKDGLFDETNANHDENFDPKLRSKIELMGSIPVFRKVDHATGPVVRAGLAMMNTVVERVKRGDSLAVYVEGTCNRTEDKTKLQHVEGGLAHIYRQAKKLGQTAAIVSVGINYGPDNDAKHASIFFNQPLADIPDKPNEITARVADDLQEAVHQAAAQFAA